MYSVWPETKDDFVAGQEGDHVGDVLRPAHPAERCLLAGHLPVLLGPEADPFGGGVGHRGGDVAGRDRVDVDVVAAQFLGTAWR